MLSISRQKLSQVLLDLLARAKMAERTFMVVVAIIIGCLGGLGAVVFRALIDVVQHLAWGPEPYSLGLVRALPWWHVLIMPAIGGLLVGPLIHFLAREAKGHGVPEVMEAVALRSGVIRRRLMLVKTVASALSIGSGGSTGREGPIVQIGAAVGSTIGQWLRLSGGRLRTMVGCGAAAGIAATFNAPVAGALFAAELILGDFGVIQFSPLVISSVMATVVSRHYLGDFPAFLVPPHELRSAWELPIYVFLGFAAALTAIVFVRGLYKLEDLWDNSRIHPLVRPAVGGLMVGALAIYFPEIMGSGYEAINEALQGHLALWLLAALIAVKILGTGITLGSGGSGGVFAPSLLLGAMTGAFVGDLAHTLFPHIAGGPGGYALVGMGAVVAGATHAPLTAILIIFELTTDYKLILPLMAACIISTLVTTRVMKDSIYTRKLSQRGIKLSQGREINVLRALQVSDVMSSEFVSAAASEPLGAVLDKMTSGGSAYAYVLGEGDRLLGVTALPEIGNAFTEGDVLQNLLVASDIAREDVPVVTPEQNLDTVMHILAGKNRDEIPVVEDLESRQMLGVVHRRHLMDAYNREIMKRDLVAGLRADLAAASRDAVHLGDTYVMAEVDAPGEFCGHTISELNVRARYNVQILLIHRPTSGDGKGSFELVPGPTTEVLRGDRLVVLAREEDVERLRRL